MDFGRDLAQLEAFHVSHLLFHLLSFFTKKIIRAIILQIGDYCIFVWMILDLMHQPSDQSCSIVFILLDCSMWNTLDPTGLRTGSQNLFSFGVCRSLKTVGWYRVMKDNSFGSGLPEC